VSSSTKSRPPVYIYVLRFVFFLLTQCNDFCIFSPLPSPPRVLQQHLLPFSAFSVFEAFFFVTFYDNLPRSFTYSSLLPVFTGPISSLTGLSIFSFTSTIYFCRKTLPNNQLVAKTLLIKFNVFLDCPPPFSSSADLSPGFSGFLNPFLWYSLPADFFIPLCPGSNLCFFFAFPQKALC